MEEESGSSICCEEGGGSWRNRLEVAFCPGAKWWPTGFIRLSLWKVDPVGSSDR